MKSRNSKSEKSRKRETDLIDLKIVNLTEKVFPDETKLMLASTNLMRRVTRISKDAIKEFSVKPDLSAVMNLFARNRSLIHFSIVCLMNGGYAPTKVLSRVALENILCMRLFNKKPNLAKEWSENPERFRKKWTPKKIRDELFPRDSSLWKAYTEFYWKLCDYAHPSSKGWSEQISEKGILWHPIFNEDYASECIGLIFFTIVQSFQQFTNSFKKWFTPKLVKEINEVLTQDSQMVRRHFQVRAE